MDVPKEIYLALKEIRISSKKLESLSLSTRVVQDLGIYGDDFDDFYELLAQNYQSSEKFDPIYCPDEFAWTKQLILWLPFVSVKKHIKCAPLTLQEVHNVMTGQSASKPEEAE